MKPVLGMQKYGKNFKAIAEAMGTKTQTHLKTFYVHYRKRYKLDTILQKYDAEQNSIIELSDDEDEQVSYTYFSPVFNNIIIRMIGISLFLFSLIKVS